MKGALRWRCSRQGCHLDQTRHRLEALASALPGKIAFSDVDGVVERRGNFLFLEFKTGEPRPLPCGQRLLLERLTRLSRAVTAALVFVDSTPDELVTLGVQVCRNGRWSPVEPCDTDRLKARIARWITARAHPTHSPPELHS